VRQQLAEAISSEWSRDFGAELRKVNEKRASPASVVDVVSNA